MSEFQGVTPAVKATRQLERVSVDNQPEQDRRHQPVLLAPATETLALLQRKADQSAAFQNLKTLQRAADASGRAAAPQKTANRTGLPDTLKSGVEALSGVSLDDVQVHRNSDKPAQLQAKAFAQGTQIHLGPGQDQHLPHEAWHVAQQKQGRVNATVQMQDGVPVNDEDALEREADIMGAKAASYNGLPSLPTGPDASGKTPVVQGFFDEIEDAANNKRKVGVEITETNAGGNGVEKLTKTGAWDALAAPAQAALWTHTVNLPGPDGGGVTWQVAAANTLKPTHFNGTGGSKSEVMRWGSVIMTEDYGEFEWIIRHPSDVQGVTYYRDQLAAVNTAREAMRAALNGLGIGNELVIAMAVNPVDGHAFYVNLQGTNDASSQITFESNIRAKTKKALMEGLTHGLNKTEIPNRASLVGPDDAIVATVTQAAARVVLPNVDLELIAAFLIGDVSHKIATLIEGTGWDDSIAANFKQWRTLFPKSHPSQIMFQAMDENPTPTNIAALQGAFAAQQAGIVDDVVALFAQKLIASTANIEWQHTDFTDLNPDHDVVFNAATAGVMPAGGLNALKNSLGVFLTDNGIDTATEFTNALNALTDYTGRSADVVRSTGFASHSGSNKGFAFEDRAEVETSFPGLASTYARIKSVVTRY